jgi:hypothetical protein
LVLAHENSRNAFLEPAKRSPGGDATRPLEEGVALFGPLPERGIWTAVGLARGQFLAILALSVALFLAVGGPAWRHLHDTHFTRIAVSYAAIPLAVTLALHRNRTLRPGLLLAASAVLAGLKLLLTAGLLVAFALARS